MYGEAIILGGDLNFSMGASEVWGPKERGPFIWFFFSQIKRAGVDRCITYQAKFYLDEVGEDKIAKRINWILVSNNFMENPIQTRQWIGSVCESDHPPILLEVAGSMRKSTIPFNFNSTWLKEASFHNLVKEHWISYDHRSGVSPII